ncbi:MAG: hypothetical protein U0169_11330 [Polyangiaceae bacterium]
MRFTSIVLTGFAAATLVVGCASDPNKQVQAATNSEAETTAEYQAKQNQLAADQRSQQLELEKKQREDRAGLAGERERAQFASQTDVEKARADMAAERKAFVSESNEKVTKLTARAEEFQKKASKLSAKAKSSYQSDLAHYTTKRAETTSEINGLDAVNDATWEKAKTSVRSRIDELEHAVDGISKHF